MSFELTLFGRVQNASGTTESNLTHSGKSRGMQAERGHQSNRDDTRDERLS
jgi:hypothetical protein